MTTTVPPDLMALWAKLEKSDGEEGAYHPLLYHLLDVAAVASILWSDVLTNSGRLEIATRLGMDENDAGRWVVFLAAVHDIGKGCPLFQLQDPSSRDRLRLAGVPTSMGAGKAPHGMVSAFELRTRLQSFGLDQRTARDLAVVVGGHHGSLPSNGDLRALPTDAVGDRCWSEIRGRVVAVLATELSLPADVVPTQPSNSTALWLAGFVSVADWIGSNQVYFRFGASDADAPPRFDPAYYERATQNARHALTGLGWLAQPGQQEARDFRDLFGYHPNTMQQQVISLGDHLDQPGLVIIEAPMGEGKTEAALWLADQWRLRLGQRGLYVALPTQATSDQMFGRVRDFLLKRYPGDAVNTQLLHGHASLSAAFQDLRRTGDLLFQPGDIGGEGVASVAAAEWFTHRKRGLLAPFGVGTIDQMLLAVLQSRHNFVRLFGLTHKTVVIDEVHAYDIYMSTLLETLLAWLGALGTSVVLLSATLPNARRRSLLGAYASGAEPDRPIAVPDARYPRVSVLAQASAAETIHIPTAESARKTIGVRWVDAQIAQDGSFPLGGCIQERLAGGGTAAIICNTVARAQAVYQALKHYFPDVDPDGQPELDLFHARYPFEERERREQRTLLRYGKPGAKLITQDGERTMRRPHRGILVATQIVEQSLDLDFDLLITDLAPVDLTLQRAGRLHRHNRSNRPVSVAVPQVWIGAPTFDSGGVPVFERGSTFVYFPHVLLRSWLALRERTEISIPDDIEALIEAVYGPADAEDLLPSLRHCWEKTRADQDASLAKDTWEARRRQIREPGDRCWIEEILGEPRQEDAPDLHPALQAMTRLTDPSVPVIFLEGAEIAPTLHGEAVDLSEAPSPVLTRGLLRRSVTLSDWRVLESLLAEDAPTGWQRSPLLRLHRPVILPSVGGKEIGKGTIRLDPELGVVITTT